MRQSLPEAFAILTFIGLWKSEKWNTWKNILYYCWTILLAYHFVTFFIFGFLGLIFYYTDIIDLVTNSSIVITMFTVPQKMFNIITNRDKIFQFVEDLNKPQFKVQNDYEKKLTHRYRKFIRLNTWVYIAFVQISAIIFDINKIYDSKINGGLAFKVWYPYDTSSSTMRLFTSYQQVITIFLCANVHVAFDALLLGMMVQICLQVNILKDRFGKMIDNLEIIEQHEKHTDFERQMAIERQFFTKYVHFHNSILSLVDNLIDMFSSIMFIQFCSSSLIFCTSVYVLSQTPVFTSDFVACLVYILCMFFQIFLPCLVGNQMTIEFDELTTAMYSTNWYKLSNNVRKYMNFIMLRSKKPIVFSSGHMLSLSLSAFRSLLKLSYTIFNVFQKSS